MVIGMILGGHAIEVVAIVAIILILWVAIAVIRFVRSFMAGARNTAP